MSAPVKPVFPFHQDIYLEDDRAILRPLCASDIDALFAFVQNEPELFSYALQPMNTLDDLKSYINHALSQRKEETEYPFIVIDKMTGTIAGTTRFYLINTTHSWLAIGYTWISKSFQQTGLNRSMKNLMLSYSFNDLKFHRVEFRVDKENEKSIRALESIGAIKEAEFRDHMFRGDGTRRNTLIFSIISRDFFQNQTF